ncbi:hypothetical protein VQZ33_004755 [Salmonella enterica]|nr:hypothetical protein [Salmonella enterica]EMD3096272.1 hypothetical protein [Salmonella enterica]EMD3332095.1 hypothetical protein [Salmonella enterica]EMD4058475.1 hypothetical protein [Salmonella enterica]EMD4075506.1 hypothetical protein [Salmonella enterica]
MSGLLPYFVNLRAKVKSGLNDVVFWISAKSDARALREMENALEDADIKRSAFFKDAIITGLPVYNDLPQEGELDFTWCERYAFSDDTGTWLPVASAQPEPAASDNASISEGHTDENATNNAGSGDTASTASTASAASAADTAGAASTAADTSNEVAGSETATDAATSCDVNVNGEPMNEVVKGMEWSVMDLPLPVRWMAQKGRDSKVLSLKPAERERLTKILEADENDNQHLTNIKAITAGEIAPEIEKLTPYHLHRLVTAFDKVSEKVERMGPSMSGRFVRAWLDTEYIDQGILVNEWCAGRHVSRIEKPTAASASEVSTTQKKPAIEAEATARPRRSEKPTHQTINYELACGFCEDLDLNNLRPAMDFAKRIIAEDREDWKRMSMTVGIIPDIKDYDRQTIIDLVRKAPPAVHSGSPELRRAWCESFLAVHGVRDPDWYEYTPGNATVTHEENQARIRKAGKCLRDIEKGKFQHEEEPQPAGAMADEPAAPEAVEQDTTECHPDTQPLENEPPVGQTEAGYQKIRAELEEARKNIPPKNPVDVGKQLAAARGEYVEGISDPSDPKWVRDDYSASNKGEKTENEDADDVNQNDDTVIQNTDSVNHSEPSADQTEPEVPETGPKSLQPEPVTKVADGVFDASAFFADTSNQGEKTEVTPPNNDDRLHECTEEKATDAPAPVRMESLLQELVRLQSINNQLLEACIAYQSREEARHERFMGALFCGITRFTSCWLEGEEDVKFEEWTGDS